MGSSRRHCSCDCTHRGQGDSPLHLTFLRRHWSQVFLETRSGPIVRCGDVGMEALNSSAANQASTCSFSSIRRVYDTLRLPRILRRRFKPSLTSISPRIGNSHRVAAQNSVPQQYPLLTSSRRLTRYPGSAASSKFGHGQLLGGATNLDYYIDQFYNATELAHFCFTTRKYRCLCYYLSNLISSSLLQSILFSTPCWLRRPGSRRLL